MMETTMIPIGTPFLPRTDLPGSAGTATWREIQQICKSHDAARKAECINACQFTSRQALYAKLDSMIPSTADAVKAPLLILDGDAEDNDDLIRCLNLRYMVETYEQRGQPTTVRIKDRRRRA